MKAKILAAALSCTVPETTLSYANKEFTPPICRSGDFRNFMSTQQAFRDIARTPHVWCHSVTEEYSTTTTCLVVGVLEFSFADAPDPSRIYQLEQTESAYRQHYEITGDNVRIQTMRTIDGACDFIRTTP